MSWHSSNRAFLWTMLGSTFLLGTYFLWCNSHYNADVQGSFGISPTMLEWATACYLPIGVGSVTGLVKGLYALAARGQFASPKPDIWILGFVGIVAAFLGITAAALRLGALEWKVWLVTGATLWGITTGYVLQNLAHEARAEQ